MYSDLSKRVARQEVMSELALLSASELEVVGHCVVCAIEGEPMAHRGLSTNNNPSGYTVDTFSHDRVVAAEYSTEPDYFESGFSKLKKDAKHVHEELNAVSRVYFVSNSECRNSKLEPAHQVVRKELTTILPQDIMILSARELADEIVERFVLGANQLSIQIADILPAVQRQRDLHVFELAVPILPKAFVRDEHRYKLISERVGSERVCVVFGLSGEGKTLATADWVRANSNDFEHVLWIQGVDLPASMNFEAVPVARYGSKVNLASRLASGRTLVVVDDYEGSLDSLVDAFNLHSGPDSRLLVTAQRVSSSCHAPIRFRGVSDLTAAAILGLEVNDSLCRAMSNECSNLPLALGLIKDLKDDGVNKQMLISDLSDLPHGEDTQGQTIAKRLMRRHVTSLGQELAGLKILGSSYESALLDFIFPCFRTRKLEHRAMLIRDSVDQYTLHKLVWNALDHIDLPHDSSTEARFWDYVAENVLIEPRHFRVTLELQRDLVRRCKPTPPKPNLRALAYLKLSEGSDDQEFIEHVANSSPELDWFAVAAWIEALEWRVRHSPNTKEVALDAAERLANVTPKNEATRALLLHHQGKFLNLARSFQKAYAMFESVLEVDPHFYQARLALARIDRREKRNKSAISHLESIIEASRNSPAKIGISVVLAAYAETASYPSLQKKYIKDDPEPFFELYERSNVEGFDQPLRTLIAFGRALEYNAPHTMLEFAKRVPLPAVSEVLSERAAGDWGELFLILAACSDRVGESKKRDVFAKDAAEFLTKGPPKSFVATRTAKAYLLCDQPDSALAALLGYEDEFALFYKAQAQYCLGQNEDALALISQAIKLAEEESRPDRYLWDFFRWRGKIEEVLGESDCTSSYKRAIELCPDDAKDDLAALYQDLNRVRPLG